MLNYVYPIIGAEKELPFYIDAVGFHIRQHKIVRTKGFHVSQILYSTKGEGVLKLGSETYSITPGTSFFLPPNVPHEYYPVADVWDVHYITFYGYGLNDLLKTIGLTKEGVYQLTDVDRLEVIFKKMLYTVATDKIYGNFYASSYLYEFFIEYYRQISGKFTYDTMKANSIMPIILAYIDENYSSDLNMESLCKVGKISPQHLCRLFKKHLNIRPMEYIARKRINVAKNLLKESDKTIGEIAEKIGFHKPDYFTILFKRYEKLLPSEYRKTMH